MLVYIYDKKLEYYKNFLDFFQYSNSSLLQNSFIFRITNLLALNGWYFLKAIATETFRNSDKITFSS